MKKKSIFTKILISFILFVLLLNLVYGLIMVGYFFKQEGELFRTVHHNIERIMQQANRQDTITVEGLELKYIPVDEARKITKIFSNQRIQPPPFPQNDPTQAPPPSPRPFPPFTIEVINGFFERVLIIQSKHQEVAVENVDEQLFYYYMTLFHLFLLLTSSLFYYSTIKSLKPLKKLGKEIEAFGQGQMPIVKERVTPDDEISRIQVAFYDAAAKISALNEAREIFLKNAAHELKTPIAKGLVATHLLEEGREREWLLDIFSRMEEIIQELVTAEEIYANEFKADIEPIQLLPFCLHIREKLFMKESTLMIEHSGTPSILADRRLLEIALSNIIDNGVKFSEDHRAHCTLREGTIHVKNLSDPLPGGLEQCSAPFYKETSLRNEFGNGLGLYLAKKVLEIQKLGFYYEHIEGWNIFTIQQNS